MLFPNIKKILCLILLCFATCCYADTLDTQLSSDKVSIGDTFSITYTLNSNANHRQPDFSVLTQDFHIISTNYGSAVNMINGATTMRTFWQVTLAPRKTGTIQIPAVSFGQVMSEPTQITVEEAGNRVVDNDHDGDTATTFVQAEISNTKPYVQSQVLYTFKLYYQTDLERPNIDLPQIKDASFVQLGDGRNYRSTFKGKNYLVVEKNFALFPTKAGTVTIPATRFHALTFRHNANMFDDPYDQDPPKSLSLATESFTLDVKDVPVEYSGQTWLPAKNVALSEKWSTEANQWEVGTPVSRTLTVEAEGLRADQIPDLAIDKIDGVNVYIDPPKRNNRIQADTVIGVLEQKVTYIPNVAEVTIPALKLNWWNTETNRQAVAQVNGFTTAVKGKVHQAAPARPVAKPELIDNAIETAATSATNDTAAPVKDPKTLPFYWSIWFWVAIVFFAIWLLTLLVVWERKTPKKVIKAEPKIKPRNHKPLSDKSLDHACTQGDAKAAQQFLLAWAKQQWPDAPCNLEKIREGVSDENFKNAITALEQAIYSKSEKPWNGYELLSAYKQVKKQKQFNTKARRFHDLLPPLNP